MSWQLNEAPDSPELTSITMWNRIYRENILGGHNPFYYMLILHSLNLKNAYQQLQEIKVMFLTTSLSSQGSRDTALRRAVLIEWHGRGTRSQRDSFCHSQKSGEYQNNNFRPSARLPSIFQLYQYSYQFICQYINIVHLTELISFMEDEVYRNCKQRL